MSDKITPHPSLAGLARCLTVALKAVDEQAAACIEESANLHVNALHARLVQADEEHAALEAIKAEQKAKASRKTRKTPKRA